MDLQKLNPWNWFKHEEFQSAGAAQIPVKHVSDSNEQAVPHGSVHPVLQIQQQIDQLFDNAFRGFGFPLLSSHFGDSSGWSRHAEYRPSLNVSSDEKCYQITLEAPGLTESDLNIEVDGDVLTIQGQKQQEKETKEKYFYRVERSYGAFQRTLSLPNDANPDDIQASMKNGVLSLNIPRRAVADNTVRKITINQ